MRIVVEEKLLEVLKFIANVLGRENVRWALVGSLNLALQGVDVEPEDIDTVTDREGVLKIGELLRDFVVEEIRYKEGKKMAACFGKLNVNGVLIDIIGDPRMREDESHKWKEKGLCDLVILDLGVRVPAMSLRSELDAYKILGKTEKVRKIESFLRKKEEG
ncbi:MAG: hypothetical protein DRO05_04255 [Thermoproteota archaeon]|nr:MAG: hypothetical protein DRO05_04255 [Candidatus Korarchaeota archaeon]